MGTDYKHEIKTFPIPMHVVYGDPINHYGEKYRIAIIDAMVTGHDQLCRINDFVHVIHGDLSGITSVHEDDIVRWICYHE